MKKKLSSLVLSALKPKATPYYVADEQQKGLRVRVAPSGAVTWNLAFRIKGGRNTKSVSLGPCDPRGRAGMGLSEARDRAAEILKAAVQGRDLLDEEGESRRTARERISVQELISRYAKNIRNEHRKGGALRTADDIERRLKRSLDAKLDKAAEDIRRGDISELLDPVAEDSPREAEKRRQSIGAMYRWGVAKGYVSEDPTAGTETYGRGDPRDRVLLAEEMKALWEWFNAGADNMPVDCISVLKVQMCIGARVGEVAGIDAREISLQGESMIWTLPPGRSKNKKERVTPLVGTARSIVEEALDRRKRGALFRAATSERGLAATDIGHALKHRKLPCAHFTSHDLRRTVVSAMDELGIALDTIAAVIGHQRGTRDTRTLIRHYSRPRLDNRIEAALTAWDARLAEIVAGRDISMDDNVLRFRAAFSTP